MITTDDDLKKILALDVDPTTGVVKRRGKIAGCQSADTGYWHISINCKLFPRSKVVWAYVHGEIPDCELDHKNGRSDDDRLKNLRPATRLQQMMNTRRYANNTTGVKGVSYHSTRKRYVARLYLGGKCMGCLYTTDFDEAVAFRKKLEEKHHGEWRRK